MDKKESKAFLGKCCKQCGIDAEKLDIHYSGVKEKTRNGRAERFKVNKKFDSKSIWVVLYSSVYDIYIFWKNRGKNSRTYSVKVSSVIENIKDEKTTKGKGFSWGEVENVYFSKSEGVCKLLKELFRIDN